MAQKIRIKDIAELSGVSVGTVDRILHNRPNVSKAAREKVERVMKEINYRPNPFASALAYNRHYTFYIIMPIHEREAYWHEVEVGAKSACATMTDFNVDLQIVYFSPFDSQSYARTFEEVISKQPNGIVVVPTELEVMKPYTDILHEKNIPFVLIDSYVPELKPLAFFGQDPIRSGQFAARILMLIASEEKEIMLLRHTQNGKVGSRQQIYREVGFREYMQQHYPQIQIVDFDLSQTSDQEANDRLLDKFFCDHPDLHHCITMSSKAHVVGQYLLRKHRHDIQIMGYDMVNANAECLRKGTISFLIAQHAYMQGYYCIGMLFRAVVLKKKVAPVNYMPIELLTRENVDFYQRIYF